jgi:transposase
MGTAISLRDDFDGTALRQLARKSKSANQARRLLALAEIYDGGSRTSAARIGGVGLQIVRDWVVRFNARGPGGLLDGKAPGRRSLLNDAQRRALVETVERGPIPAIHGVVRWRLIDLVQWLYDEFAVSLDVTTVGRELKRLGYVKLTALPRHHAQNELALEAFKRGLCRRAGKGQKISPEGHADRDMVPGRSADRAEEQDHAALGQTRDAALGTQRPAHEFADRDMRRDFHENMDVIASERTIDDLHAQFVAHLADDLAHPEAHFAMEHLEPALGCPDDMIAMMKSRVATGRIALSL